MIFLLLAIIVVFASANVLRGIESDIEHTRVERSAARDRDYDRGHHKGGHYNEGYNKKGYYKGGRGSHKGGHHKGGHHGK